MLPDDLSNIGKKNMARGVNIPEKKIQIEMLARTYSFS